MGAQSMDLQQTKDAPRSVYLHLINQDEMNQCPFWVGVFHRGKREPQDLYNYKTCDEAFEVAAREGLAESGPVMISDCASTPPRFMFFMPEPPHDLRKKAEWAQQLVATISSWEPKQVGIYLSPMLVNQRLMSELMTDTLKVAIGTTNVQNFYLQTTTHGLNAILNTSLQVKRQVEGIDTFIFH